MALSYPQSDKLTTRFRISERKKFCSPPENCLCGPRFENHSWHAAAVSIARS